MKGKPPVIYFIETPCGQYVKAGYTTDLYPRLSTIQTGNPQELQVMFVIQGDRRVEQEVHSALRPFHVRGEWFRRTKEVEALLSELRKSAFDYDAHLDGMKAEQTEQARDELIATALRLRSQGSGAEDISQYINYGTTPA